jgi:hypothetical protein
MKKIKMTIGEKIGAGAMVAGTGGLTSVSGKSHTL